MTIFYAGLQLLPGDVMEAAQLDGAAAWQQLRYVTIPMMRETFAIVAILLITNVFKIFELVYMLTGGGPVHRSETLVSYMYFVTFTNQRYGSGMAIAVVVFVLGAVSPLGYLASLDAGASHERRPPRPPTSTRTARCRPVEPHLSRASQAHAVHAGDCSSRRSAPTSSRSSSCCRCCGSRCCRCSRATRSSATRSPSRR